MAELAMQPAAGRRGSRPLLALQAERVHGDVVYRFYRFCFRGPKRKLKLAAQNLQIFVQLGEGVDDETWLFQVRQGDYAHWFRGIACTPRLYDGRLT